MFFPTDVFLYICIIYLSKWLVLDIIATNATLDIIPGRLIDHICNPPFFNLDAVDVWNWMSRTECCLADSPMTLVGKTDRTMLKAAIEYSSGERHRIVPTEVLQNWVENY